MNEWELQHELSRRWQRVPPIVGGQTHRLVCWELMFPSWKINDRRSTWNEPSIDFVWFNGCGTFTCVELKHRIRTRRELVSAFCQTTHRAALFAAQYSPEKIAAAYEACRRDAPPERLTTISDAGMPLFPVSATVSRMLCAVEFPRDYQSLLQELNAMPTEEIQTVVSGYASTREFRRFTELTTSDVARLRGPLEASVVVPETHNNPS